MKRKKRTTMHIISAIAGLGVLTASFNLAAQSSNFQMTQKATVSVAVMETFSQTGVQRDLSNQGAVKGLSVSGSVSLHSEVGFVRVILEAANGDEYLVYETNAMLSAEPTIRLNGVCEETCSMSNVKAQSLRFEIEDASFTLESVSLVSAGATATETAAKSVNAASKGSLRKAQVAEKVKAVRSQIKEKGYKWVAGETTVSNMSYAEKKQLFGGQVPNLYGFEYYVGGIFEIPSTETGSVAAAAAVGDSSYADEFSWRERHGQSWLTSVKNQGGCGSCWAFAATGATELLTNLYYNRHLDLDLSEQDALSCSGAGNCGGGWPGVTLDYYTATGVVEEACFPYTALDDPCSDKCGAPMELVKIGGQTEFYSYYQTEDDLKAMILESAVSGGIYSWSHAMVLFGYKVLRAGDQIYLSSDTLNGFVTIPDGDPLIGKTAWHFKNSWGGSDESSYPYIVTDITNIGWTHELHGPAISPNLTEDDIVCEDADGDGFYNWGIGGIPATCPAEINETPDGDDSDPCLGPMDEYGFMDVLCEQEAVDLGAANTQNAITVDGEVLLSVSQWPSWWQWWTPNRIVISFGPADGKVMSNITAEVGGVTTNLAGWWQRIDTPFAWQDEIVITLDSATSRNLVVSWWAE